MKNELDFGDGRSTELGEFFRACKVFGSSSLYAQGGGGNISLKKGARMCIKASGIRLREVALGKGYACIRHLPLAKFLLQESKRRAFSRQSGAEAAFNARVDRAVISSASFGVPSMEAGMHAVLEKHVIHTHHVYANVLGCMRGGKKIIDELFGSEALLIPYRNPGRELALELARLVQFSGGAPRIIFLANHGLITHHEDSRKAVSASLRAGNTIASYLRARGVFSPFAVKKVPADFSRHLVPDSAVYSQIDFRSLPPAKRATYYELSSMVNYVLRTIKKLGGNFSFLGQSDVRYIRGMEREKKRMELAIG